MLAKSNENYEEAVNSLKTELKLRDELNEKLKRKLEETTAHVNREQRLIASAWYGISGSITKEIVNNKAYPKSWLGQQRRTLENQLTRR